MPKKDYNLDDILNEYSGDNNKKAVDNKPKKPAVENTGAIQNTGYIKIPAGGSAPDATITYSVDELVQVNAPEKRPSPSHASSKFQVSDVSRPNVSYINSVKEVVKNQADLPPRPADEINGYDGAVLTKNYKDDEYAPKVRKMSDSTRAKEMRGKRKKKKQPEFTYDRESPDGVYTRPQERSRKFVVLHDDEKKPKPDRMSPVDLSANAEPAALDISLEAPEPAVQYEKTGKIDKGKENTIRDYDSYEDAKEIKRSITDIRKSFSVRFAVLAVILVAVTFVSLGSMTSLPVPVIFTYKSPVSYSIIQLIAVLLSMIVSLDTVKSGLLNMLKFKADTDSLASLGAITSAATAIVCVIYPSQLMGGKIHLYAPVAVMAMLMNTLGKQLILKRAEVNFNFTVKEKKKYSISCVEDEIRAESLTRGTIGDFPILATMRRTSFLKDFSRYTFSTDSGDKLCRPLVPAITIVSALAAAAFSFLKMKTVDGNTVAFALSIFTLYISACSCMAMPLIANIPLNKAAKKYSRNHGILLGYQSVEDYYDTNSVMVDANKLFPVGTISLSSIKLFSDTKIDEAILYAASLTAHADSVMKELFSDIISGKVRMLKKIENFVCEDSMGISGWIDNKRILLGNRELMKSHNIEGVPTRTKEEEFTDGEKDALYLSVSGNLAALFVIDISASPSVVKSLKRLERYDMAVIIKTVDHFITINRIAGIFDYPEDLLKIVPTSMMKDYEEETKKVRKTSTSLAFTGKFSSFVNMLMAAKTIKKTVASGIVLQSVSALLGAGIVSLNCLMSTYTDLSPAWMIIYNLVCTIITAFIVGIREV